MRDSEVKSGTYEHFSGNRYEVIGIGHLVVGSGVDEKVGEELVVYHALFNSAAYGERHIWVRTPANFTEQVEVEGKKIPRFRYLEDSSSE